MFLTGGNSTSTTTIAHKKSSIHVYLCINNTINNLNIENCRRDLATAKKVIQHLRDQFKMQDALIATKDETISLLCASYNRPN
jgi:hypothetical protein